MSKKKLNTKKLVLVGTLAVAAGATAYYLNEEHTTYKEKKTAILSKRGTEISAVICAPRKIGNYPLVMMLHGFKGDKESTGRFTWLAQTLANRGIASVRFDFAGCGESKEPFTSYRMSLALDDVESVYQYMLDQYKVDPKKVALVGHSMGGRTCMLFAERHPEIQNVGLLAPAISEGFKGLEDFLGGEEKVKEILELTKTEKSIHASLSNGMTLDIGAGYFEDMFAYNPLESMSKYTGNLIYLQGTDDVLVPPAVSGVALQNLNPEAKLNYIYLDHVDHSFGSHDQTPEKLEKCMKLVADFLVSNL